MNVRGPWGLYLALAATSAVTLLPQGCVESAGSNDDDDDSDTDSEDTGGETGDGCPEGFPIDCGDGRCCPNDTMCVPEGCCPEEAPVNCGFGVCAPTEESCEDLGMGYPPCGGLGSCPEEGQYCLNESGWFACLPECGEECPAPGVCAFNPDSSVADCSVDGMCDDPEEMCTDNAAGGRTCLLASSHCVPLCQTLVDCPAGMDCVDGVCLFANPDD